MGKFSPESGGQQRDASQYLFNGEGLKHVTGEGAAGKGKSDVRLCSFNSGPGPVWRGQGVTSWGLVGAVRSRGDKELDTSELRTGKTLWTFYLALLFKKEFVFLTFIYC